MRQIDCGNVHHVSTSKFQVLAVQKTNCYSYKLTLGGNYSSLSADLLYNELR